MPVVDVLLRASGHGAFLGPADSEATGDLSWLSPVRTPELLSCRTDAPFLGPYINSCRGPCMAESGEDAAIFKFNKIFYSITH